MQPKIDIQGEYKKTVTSGILASGGWGRLNHLFSNHSKYFEYVITKNRVINLLFIVRKVSSVPNYHANLV